MGDRINFGFTTDTGDVLYLYSHWGASSWIKDLQDALDRSVSRIGDQSYATRITISHLIGENWYHETGYGITVNSIGDSDVEFVPIIDFAYGFVRIYTLSKDLTVEEAILKIDINKFVELDDLEIQGLVNDALIERYGQK